MSYNGLASVYYIGLLADARELHAALEGANLDVCLNPALALALLEHIAPICNEIERRRVKWQDAAKVRK